MKDRGYNACSTEPIVTCNFFEDNEGAMELERFPKMRPRTTHINQMHHRFRPFVSSSDLELFPIDTKVQIVEVFTKSLPAEQFLKLRLKLMIF